MRSRRALATLALATTTAAAFACGSPFEDSATTTCDASRCADVDATVGMIAPDDAGPLTTGADATMATGDDTSAIDASDAGAASDASSEGGEDASDAGPCGPGTYCAAVLATKPLTYFRFEEPEPTGGGAVPLKDWSGNHFTGLLASPYILGVPPAPVDPNGHAVRLSTGTVSIAPPADSGVDLSFADGKPFSISGWFNLDAVADAGPTGTFARKTSTASASNGYTVYVGNFLGFEARNGADYLFSYIHVTSADMPTGSFTHVAFTWDGTTPNMYIRGGLLVGDIEKRGFSTALPPTPLGFELTLTAGSVDEYAIYDRVLTAGEIATLSQSGM